MGGNSKYPAIGYPASTIPKKGNPSSIPAKIINFNEILLIPVITVDFAVKNFNRFFVTVHGFNVQRFRVAFPLIPTLYADRRCVRTGKDALLYDL
ncbi:MAG: hypothetical protein U9Q97_06620 [Acidobacteriota bacterium]|nr:hypothetical protein [Acidobacteriota bacterium]